MVMSRQLGLFWAVVAATIARSSIEATISCQQTIPTLLPCLSYIIGMGFRPSSKCCAAARRLDQIAVNSKADGRALCECLKNVATSARSFRINFDRTKAVCSLCHLTTNIRIDPNVDCSTVFEEINLTR